MSPFSRYSSSRVIMCTITCNQMLSCLVGNKQLHYLCSPATISFLLELRNAIFWRAMVLLCKPMQSQAIWCDLAKKYAKPLNMTGFSCIPIGCSFSSKVDLSALFLHPCDWEARPDQGGPYQHPHQPFRPALPATCTHEQLFPPTPPFIHVSPTP